MKNKSAIWWSNCISAIILLAAFSALAYKGYSLTHHWICILVFLAGFYFVYQNDVERTALKKDRFIFKNKFFQ